MYGLLIRFVKACKMLVLVLCNLSKILKPLDYRGVLVYTVREWAYTTPNNIQETEIMTRIRRSLCLILALVLAINVAAVGGSFSFGSAAESLALVAGSTMTIKDNLLADIVAGTNVATVAGNFTGDVTVYNRSGAAVADTEIVCSGYTVSNGSESLTVVISGDANFDGAISTTDVVIAENYLLKGNVSEQLVLTCLDINGDKIVSAADLIPVEAHVNGTGNLFKGVYGKAYVLTEATPKYSTSADAVNKANSTGTAAAGTYYVYKEYPHGLNGMYNLTTDATGATIGFWINPTATEEEPVTGTPYEVLVTINTYSSSTDAAEQENATGTLEPGTYYIYNKYPNGVNGMYNLTTDPTGAAVGYWINPEENVTAATYVLDKAVPKYANAVNALNKTNSTGTAEAGTYYIYNGYPNGYQGMYCLSTDPTGNTASFWINPENEGSATVGTYELTTSVPKYASSTDAANKQNSTGTAAAGTYYIYSGYPNGLNGMYNLTTDPTGATAGFWINPDTQGSTTVGTYVLTASVPKYASSTDAANKQNSTGTAAAGTYYIYSGYPNGLNGMYNLTTDSTGATAGFWINPKEIPTELVGADGKINLVRNVNKYSSSVNAANQTNITGTVDKDTAYYVYKGYPNGYNGMYNITTDPTGATAGFWINPKENTSGKLNYMTMKGIWISQYEINSMIISGSNQVSESTFTTRVKNAFTAAKNSGFNTVIVQVRPNGDSFYPSSTYPLSKYVVGSYGLATKYDPLKIMVEQAQELALSFHAWVNPMRLMTTTEIKSVGSSYLIKQWYNDSTKNGTYIVAVDGNYYLNPAYADVRNLIVDGVEEICNNYDVDGIHFDDYFYPTTASSFDAAAFASSGQTNIGTFRRACTNAMIRSTYSAIKAIDSEIVFGIAPAGSISLNTYTLYADINTWCNNTGYIDYVAPQIYWGFEHTQSPYEEILAEWVTLVSRKNIVDLIIGLDLSMAYGETDSYDGTEWDNHSDVIARQITVASTKVNFAGIMMFSMRYYYNPQSGAYVGNLTAERNNYEPVLKGLYVTED